jgi:hypothetical protein
VKIKNGYISIEPIRHLEGLRSVLTFALSVSLHTYRKILEHYRPGQVAEFNKRYIEDWRDAFLNIPEVNYAESTDAPTF